MMRWGARAWRAALFGLAAVAVDASAAAMTSGDTPGVDASPCAQVESDRPCIALVLGGGGARGGSHIGVIRALEELRVPVDVVIGTSIGALVGGLHATGRDAEELEEILRGLDWGELFQDETERPRRPMRRKLNDTRGLFGPRFGLRQRLGGGAISGQQLDLLFESLLVDRASLSSFDELAVPFRAVAADIATGEAVVLSSGSLARAMRASMSVPGFFDPVALDDYLLVDGGIANNLPIDVAHELGADVVIAVDLSTPLRERSEIASAVDIVGQLTALLVSRNTDVRIDLLTGADVHIEPPLEGVVGPTAFDRAADGIEVGYAAARAQTEALARYGVDEGVWQAQRARFRTGRQAPPALEFVEVRNSTHYATELIERRISVQAGDVADPETLTREMQGIHAIGGIQSARYGLVERDGRSGLVVDVEPDPRGTRLIETGLDYRTEGGEDALDLRIGYLDRAIDDLGSELRVTAQIGSQPRLSADVYRYLGPDQDWVITPGVFAERLDFRAFDARGVRQAAVDVDQVGYVAFVGREVGDSLFAYGGLRGAAGTISDSIGRSGVDGADFDLHQWVLGLSYDRLDSLFFPESGASVSARYLDASERLGADASFKQLRIEGTAAASRGRHTLQGLLRFNTTLGDDAPFYAEFQTGGFERLSGLEEDELAGQHFVMVGGGYRYQLNKSDLALAPGYAGMTLEYGAATQELGMFRDDALVNASAYVGYATPVGPLFIGAGFAEDRTPRFFLRVGDIFGARSFFQQ